MSDSDPVTVKEVNESVLKIVKEGNQDAITTRSVTEDIVKMYGNRLGPLKPRIKSVVRAQLKVLVASEIVVSTAKSDDGGTPKKSIKTTEDVKPSETIENVKVSTKLAGDPTDVGATSAKSTNKKKVNEDKPAKKEKSEDKKDTDEEQDDASPAADEIDEESQEDAKDSDFKMEVEKKQEEEEEEEKVIRRGRPKKRKPVKAEELDASESVSDEPTPKRRRRRKSAPKVSQTEKRMKRYMKICTSIGCRIPPGKFRGLDASEKLTVVEEFLLDKGIDVNDTMPNEKELRKLRSKLARQKELSMLDESNIINVEGRPRRSAARNISYADNYEKEKAVEKDAIEEELPPSSPDPESDSEGYVASVASSDNDNE